MERDSNEAKLSIINVREHHFTTYTLKATNDIGADSQQVVLRKKLTNSEMQQPGQFGRSVDNRNVPKHKPGIYCPIG